MVMVMIRCYECCKYKSLNKNIKTLEEKSKSFFRQLYIIEKHMYCLDCLQQCEKCLVYILKSHNNKYCNQCEMITKVNLVRNTNNDITYKLPIELVDMIISCFKKLNLK